MPTRGVGALLAAACLFLCSRLGRAGAFLVRAPAPVSLHGAGTCRARGWTAARRQAAGCRSVKLSARHDSVSWSEEDEVEVCARIASSIKRAHARSDARLQHDDNCVRPPQDGELFGLMQSVLLKVDARESMIVADASTPQNSDQRTGKPMRAQTHLAEGLLGRLAEEDVSPQKVDTRNAPAAETRGAASSRTGSALEMWQLFVSEDSTYAMIRHKRLGLAIELPLDGTSGLLFSTYSRCSAENRKDVGARSAESNECAGAEREHDTVIPEQRIWRWQPDGSHYERFCFRTGTDLHQGKGVPIDWEEAHDALKSAPSDPEWKWEFSDDRWVGLTQEHGLVQLYLNRDSFGVCGINSHRGLLVADTTEPEALDMSQWRKRLHVPASSGSHPNKEDTMAFNKRKRLGTLGAHEENEDAQHLPTQLLCPLTGALMLDPWIAADGHSYEKKAIQEWFSSRGARSPTTGLPLSNTDLIPNNALRAVIVASMQT